MAHFQGQTAAQRVSGKSEAILWILLLHSRYEPMCRPVLCMKYVVNCIAGRRNLGTSESNRDSAKLIVLVHEREKPVFEPSTLSLSCQLPGIENGGLSRSSYAFALRIASRACSATRARFHDRACSPVHWGDALHKMCGDSAQAPPQGRANSARTILVRSVAILNPRKVELRYGAAALLNRWDYLGALLVVPGDWGGRIAGILLWLTS